MVERRGPALSSPDLGARRFCASRTCAPRSSRAMARSGRSTASASTSRTAETVGLVGESGCGKSVTALSIMRLLTRPGPHRRRRNPLSRQESCERSANEEMRRIRGNEISMIFQEPMTSLNPVLTVGDQIAETVRLHQGAGRREARGAAIEMLRLVEHSRAAASACDSYPHQFSGGMRQRVMIAMALACTPEAADRRRADHGARRHHSGADPRADRRAAAAARHGGAADHARSRRGRRTGRRGRGDVCRQDRRTGEA